MAFQKVASRADLPDGKAIVVEASGQKIAVFNSGGKLYAIGNTCKHRGGPLCEGDLDGTTVICPWHGWEYDITTGNNLDDPKISVGSYPVRVEGEDILVDA